MKETPRSPREEAPRNRGHVEEGESPEGDEAQESIGAITTHGNAGDSQRAPARRKALKASPTSLYAEQGERQEGKRLPKGSTAASEEKALKGRTPGVPVG